MIFAVSGSELRCRRISSALSTCFVCCICILSNPEWKHSYEQRGGDTTTAGCASRNAILRPYGWLTYSSEALQKVNLAKWGTNTGKNRYVVRKMLKKQMANVELNGMAKYISFICFHTRFSSEGKSRRQQPYENSICLTVFSDLLPTLHCTCYRIDAWAIRRPWLTFVNALANSILGRFYTARTQRFASWVWPMVLRKLGIRWKWEGEAWFHYTKVLFVGVVGIAEMSFYLV